MSGVFSLIAVILSFGITALLGKWLIPFLKRINFGQTIREEGPKWHIKKDGTPTMKIARNFLRNRFNASLDIVRLIHGSRLWCNWLFR